MFYYQSFNVICFSVSATPYSVLSMSQLFVYKSLCHYLLLVSVSLVLSPSVLFPCISSAIFLHCSISLFLTTPHFVKSCSQTFRYFLWDCKQVSCTLCRHELVLMLEMCKSTARKGKGIKRLQINCMRLIIT